MEILIIGAEELGKRVVNALVVENYKVTIIDSSGKNLSNVRTNSQVEKVQGNALERELLKKLNVEKYDYVVSLTKSDKMNILICTMAKSLGAKYTISLIEKADSIDELFYLRDFLGIDYIVNPDLESAREVEKIIKGKKIYQSDSFGNGKIEVVGHYVDNDLEFGNEKIKNIGSLATVLVVAIQRGNELIIPNGETEVRVNDYLYIMGLTNDIMSFKMKYFKFNLKEEKETLLVVGSDSISKKIFEMMSDYNIIVIEKDREKVANLMEEYPEIFVMRKDYSKIDFFEDLDLDNVDIFLGLTENDELNIVLGMMAKKLEIPKIIIELQSVNYSKIVDSLGFTAVLYPLILPVNKIIKKLSENRSISTQLAFNGEAEISEVRLEDDSKLIGKLVKDLAVPKGVLIGGIKRKDDSAIIPRGNSKIEKGDTLILFYKKENRRQLEKFIIPGEKKGFLDKYFI